jgi:hypothetical protein
MDGDRFDSATKAAMLGGRRAAIRNLGLFAGGMAALLGAREVDAKERKRTKKRRQGKAGAEASPENPGVPPHACCTPCPATGSECLIAVRDASTGKCEKIPKRSGLPCGSSGTCGSDGTCYECNDTLCPTPGDPTGETLVCANLDHEGNFCGSCDTRCNFDNQENCCFGTCCSQLTHMCMCEGPGGQNCSCQPFPTP